jgi:type II secretory pathway pseudopilin PulG
MKHNTLIHEKTRSSMSGAGGFSVIEMLIGSAVFVVVLLAILMILDISQRDYASGAAKSDVQENVRVVLESMARELRMAGYAPSNSANSECAVPPCGVTDVITASLVTFQADVNNDNLTDKVIYAFVPPVDATRPCDALDPDTVGRITRSVQSWVVGAWTTLTAYDVAQCIKTMTITYYNSAGGAAATPADVRRIKMSITGEENVRGYTPRDYTLSTDVRLRNL